MLKKLGNVLSKMVPTVVSNQFVTGLNNSTPPALGTEELLGLYSRSPWLRAVVHKVGQSVAEVQWRLFVAKKGGRAVRDSGLQSLSGAERGAAIKAAMDRNEVQEIKSHPLLDLLVAGNDEMTGFAVMQTTQNHLDLVGEGFWLLERNKLGTPIAVWPLPPTWIKGLPSGGQREFLVGSGPVRTKIPASEIIYFRDVDPANPYKRGVGTARSLGDELEIDEFSSKHTRAFFYNRARPDLIISGDNIGQADAKRLEAEWLEKHKGWFKAFKPLFFSRKIDVRELGQSFENIQMVQLRKHERDTFINVFGVPPEKIGVVSDSKRSTIASADLFWQKDVIRPRLELLRTTMQKWLVPIFDNRMILTFDTPVMHDEEMELQKMKEAPWAYTLNQWRSKTGDASLGKIGDQLLIPLNNVLVPVDGGRATPVGPKPGAPKAGGKGITNADVQGIVADCLKDLQPQVEAVAKTVAERAKLARSDAQSKVA